MLINDTKLQLHAELYCGAQGKLSEEWVKTKISSFLHTNKKAFQDYCLGKSIEHDPLSFMRWIDTQNYHYEGLSRIYKLKNRGV
jgi:hypothetical protein